VIPQRIKLKGFLCYKDEQEIGFDGNATLWMLSGLNGSGKSSIFDAVTYVLFGHHRGGGTNNQELINKDCDGLAVEFDFLLDGQAYRAKRTLKRDARGGSGKSTQQVYRLGSGENGHAKWLPVEGTETKRGFDPWVRDNIGLNYDTFTSSVLLLQGKAEKLLDSKPEGRREVLARIVDLERYEKLYQKADEQRKALKNRLDDLSNRLDALPPVSPEELAAVGERIDAAEAARAKARAEVERLQRVELQAAAWLDMQKRLEEARERLRNAESLLGDAAAIEKAVERLREVREVMPRLQVIVEQRGATHAAEQKIQEAEVLRQRQVEALAQRDAALKQARDKRTTLQSVITAEETKHRDIAARLRQTTAKLEKLKEYERHESDLVRIREDLARLPADPAAAVATAREACDTLSALAQTLPLLSRFRERREELRQALETECRAQQKLQAIQAQGKHYAAEVEKLKAPLEEATRAAQQASDQATEARTRLQQARESLREVTQLDGSKVCRHCGQALTPGHIKEEKRRRAKEVADADARSIQATEAYQAARTEEQRLREQYTQAEKTLLDARLEFSSCKQEAEQARKDVARLQAECTRAYGELPEPYRSGVSPAPVADWLGTILPTQADVDALRAEASGLTAARQQLRQAEQVQQEWAKFKEREAGCLQNLNRLQSELPSDRQAVRQEHVELEAQEKSLDKALEAKRAQVKEADKELDRFSREREKEQLQLVEIDGQVKKQQVVREHAQQTLAKALKALPPSWQAQAEKAGMRDLMTLDKERDELEKSGIEERGKSLQQSRANLDVLRQDKEALEARAAAFPPEARQDTAALQAQLTAARQADRTCDEELRQAGAQRALLDNRLRQRLQIEEEYLESERELATQKTLSELLGKDRLQLYLVRQAERQVVEHANAVLDRLSGGQLYLKLSGEADGEGSSAKALELEAFNRATGERPINVAFLSGSQKFRVAVSLALGIGQYASRQHRPIESVIIDEGFGCLDSQGRQVMIQELHNLRGQMRCILLVSHQEEFAEAFPDGYYFELESGATRVKRFQK
jgi:exonuclease SbcC